MRLLAGLMALPLLSSSLFGQAAVEQKTYLLAKENNALPVKEKFKVIKRMATTDAKIGIEVADQTMNGTMNNSNKEEIIYDFLSEDQIRVTYEKKRSLEKSTMAGNETDEEVIDPSEGKTILLEKKDGKWVAKLEKGKIEEADQESFDETLKDLAKEFNEDGDPQLYGTEPRKVGDSWDVDPKAMPGMEEFDVKGGNLTMTFVEVKDFQGEPCAVLKTSFKIDAEMMEKQMKGMGVSFAGNGRVVRSLKYLTDYKFTGEMKMKMSGDMEIQPGMNAKMTMTGDMKIDMRMAKAKEAAKAE
ncbi:MAG: hypothetical protein ACI9NQ_001088 [Paracoccaceae bacterium]|jgi:hypothetical protein